MNIKQKRLLLQAAVALVELRPPLDMGSFRGDTPQVSKKEPCGSSGCFVGWYPFLGVPGLELKDEDFTSTTLENCHPAVNFAHYSERVFRLPYYSRGWNWYFGTSWPNSHEEVLNRVKFGVVSGYFDQIDRVNGPNASHLVDINCRMYSMYVPSLEEAKVAVGIWT